MKKKVGIVIFVVIILIIMAVFIGKRIYYFTVIRNVYEAIENFRNEDNRYYAVTTKDEKLIKEEVMIKSDIVKCNEQRDGVNEYCQWKNFKSDQEYSIIFKDKTFSKNDLLILKHDLLKNLPNLILNIYKDNKININELSKIKNITTIEYFNKKCYKIITNTQTLIVDQETYLPIYYSVETINSEENINLLTETTYDFKVGEVTDEDIALPDLTGFTQINEE